MASGFLESKKQCSDAPCDEPKGSYYERCHGPDRGSYRESWRHSCGLTFVVHDAIVYRDITFVPNPELETTQKPK